MVFYRLNWTHNEWQYEIKNLSCGGVRKQYGNENI